jgi:hypothetical protein
MTFATTMYVFMNPTLENIAAMKEAVIITIPNNIEETSSASVNFLMVV